jgi:UDP-glucose 4-epimerase
MKVFVTGGAGFIGSHIVEELLKHGYSPIVIDNLSTGKQHFLPLSVPFYNIDITSPGLEEIFKKERPTFVIHQAAQVDVTTSIKNPLKDAKTNIIGTIHLLQLSHKYKIKRFVFASSCAVYGETNDCSILESFPLQPLSFYGLSKLTSEMYIQQYYDFFGLPFSILRYSNVYGPRQTPKGEGGVIAIFFQKLLTESPPNIYGDGKQTRDFIYVKDVATANVKALFTTGNHILNISSNTKLSINDLFDLLMILTKKERSPVYKQKRKGDISFSRLNNEKAKKILCWNPLYSIKEGLNESLQFYIPFSE